MTGRTFSSNPRRRGKSPCHMCMYVSTCVCQIQPTIFCFQGVMHWFLKRVLLQDMTQSFVAGSTVLIESAVTITTYNNVEVVVAIAVVVAACSSSSSSNSSSSSLSLAVVVVAAAVLIAVMVA